MTPCKELYDLLTNHVIKDVESVVKQMNDYANENEITPEMQEERNGLLAIHENFLDIQNAIEDESIETKNCEELLKELNMMRQMEA
ncbi:MAG: hypothetical protein U9R50_10045 [Campylobacterota bacterium]|nr:hypothetical protein [Campylobacterota bacterium]